MGASLLIPSLLVNCTVSNLAKPPTIVVNHHWKALRGVDNMIFTFTYLQAQLSFGYVNNFPAGKAKRKEDTDYSDKGRGRDRRLRRGNLLKKTLRGHVLVVKVNSGLLKKTDTQTASFTLINKYELSRWKFYHRPTALPQFNDNRVGRLSFLDSRPTEFLGSSSSILPTKRYHIIILDINIITVSAPFMDAMVVKPAYLP